MKKVCGAQQMRDIDRAAAEKGGIPGIVLMENAALACVDVLKVHFGTLKNKRIAVFCGKGNNGGDGFAIARHLHNIGANVTVFLVCGMEFQGDALINFNIIKGMGLDIRQIVDTEYLSDMILGYDAVADAIFGTGIHGEMRGIAPEVTREINENAKFILAVDVPSGMNSDTGEAAANTVKADVTVTFAAYKLGMFKYPAADFTGKIFVKDISIPDYIIDEQNITVNVTDDEFVRKMIPKRENNSQKGDYGKVLVIAGSRGMTGAAYLASQSAVSAGSGLVTLGVCRELNPILEVKTTEVMTLPLPDRDGHLSEAASGIAEKVNRFDAVLIGPGLGRSTDAAAVLRAVLRESKIPIVIDADGINIVSEHPEMLDDCVCPIIFTPHTVEMSRLSGLDREYIEENRFDAAHDFAEKYGVTLLLKGHHTVVTAPDGVQYTNNTGNPGLATGGSGDVLAGIVVSLAARGIDEAAAAAAAAHIHGTAGDIARDIYGEESVTAERVMECIPKAICHILQVEK